MKARFKLILNDVYILSMMGNKTYLPIGLEGNARTLEPESPNTVMIDLEDVKIGDNSGPLNLTFEIEEFNIKFEKLN